MYIPSVVSGIWIKCLLNAVNVTVMNSNLEKGTITNQVSNQKFLQGVLSEGVFHATYQNNVHVISMLCDLHNSV